MLVLSRKVDEKLMIGDDVILTVTKITGGRVTVAIDAPREVAIRRGELAPVEPSRKSPQGGSQSASLHVAACHA